jgi:hypothetical protein
MKNSWLLHIHLLGYYCDHPCNTQSALKMKVFVLAAAASGLAGLAGSVFLSILIMMS